MTSVADPLEQLSLAELRQRTSIKWRQYPADVLPLWVAEMDVVLAEPVVEAVSVAMRRGDTGYPVGTAYAEALAGFAERRWGWSGVDVGRTALVPDVMQGVVETVRLVTDPGDTVVVSAPVYPPFAAFVAHDGRRVVEAALSAEGRLDVDDLDRLLGEAVAGGGRAAYLMSNPHNPTGAVHTRAELEAVAAVARRHGARVVADEIHAPLVLDGASFTPYLSVAGAEDAFAVTSASKTWNLAGLKAAVLVAGPEAADDLARLPEEVGHGASHVAVLAHTAAMAHGEPWLDALLAGLAGKRALLGDLVAEHLPGVGFTHPEGTYLAWLDCRSLGLPSGGETTVDGPGEMTDLAGPARFFLDEARVALSAGHAFGTGGAGHVRLNYATTTEVLTEALTRAGAAVARRRGSRRGGQGDLEPGQRP
ncbi:MalY/PatB family protein [Nocardioides sp. CFH 31398]|uniref:MalY/PatB family protein n=1 Tax=Nocardioides sp. CFH 31398 TaxID=2919579 RepID=UPI001F061884|nr:aminotransferase class I/II-fold pyridoxal phosphate-dependent enzyme [Nocardioides sp. CFH 31398]MCH1866225.1 aminotransferase class I/II-fold pyridoxal phosphate-dependent enzyme [Nocardioides sp. CFH 31398]